MGSMCNALGQHVPKLQAVSPTVTLLVRHSSVKVSLGPRPLITTLVTGWRRSFSSGLLLDLPQYSQMWETLAGRKGGLRVLESAGIFILDMENLGVNTTVLDLNLKSHTFVYERMAKYEEIKKLKATGVI